MKWRQLILRRDFSIAEQLRRRGLIESGIRLGLSNHFEQTQSANSVNVRSVLRHLETDADVALSSQIVNLVRQHIAHDTAERDAIVHISVKKFDSAGAWATVGARQMVYPRAVD